MFKNNVQFCSYYLNLSLFLYVWEQFQNLLVSSHRPLKGEAGAMQLSQGLQG